MATATKRDTASKSAKAAKPSTHAQHKSSTAQCMHTVTPHIICGGANQAIDFYKKAFGAEELFRLNGTNGKLLHGSIRIGDSMVMLTDEHEKHGSFGPKHLQGTPVTIHLNVPDADAFVARAVDAGARLTMPVQDMFWGDRYGQIVDPFGHRWSVATHIRDVSPEDMQKAVQAMRF